MEQIREYFKSIAHLTDKDWQFFSSRLNREEFPRRHLLLKAGKTESYLSFIETGIIRFYIPKEENELTFYFAFANEFVSGYDSFLTQMPSVYHIETLSATTLWRISYNALQEVYRHTEIGNFIGRHAGEHLYLDSFKRELSLLSDTAEQRYLKLFTEQSRLIQQIPLKYLASYIGVTPQALSRIRKRIY